MEGLGALGAGHGLLRSMLLRDMQAIFFHLRPVDGKRRTVSTCAEDSTGWNYTMGSNSKQMLPLHPAAAKGI